MSIKKEIINEEKVTKICYVNRESSVIAVSNRFLELMHNFTATQIDMVYEVVAAVQKYRVAEADLPDKLIVGIEFKVLTQKHSLQNIIDSIGKLGKGAVMFWDRRRQDDKVFKHTTYMFHGIDIRHDLKMAVFDIHCDCISKIFTAIETEFTILNVDKLLDIPHVYAKRMYLLCNRWKNKEGHLMYKLDAFRYMMGLNPIIRKGNKPKFKQISELKRKVLDNSEKTLKEISDVWFKYELVKHESASINVIGIDL
jgi:plasmid replication initiation protein